MDIGVDGHMVLGEIVVHEASELLIHYAFLVESHADAPHDSTHDLASRRFWIEDASTGNRGNDTRNLDRAEVRVNFDFNKYGSVGTSYVPRLLYETGLDSNLFLDVAGSLLAHYVFDQNALGWIVDEHDLTVRESDIFKLSLGQRRIIHLACTIEDLFAHLLAHRFNCGADRRGSERSTFDG